MGNRLRREPDGKENPMNVSIQRTSLFLSLTLAAGCTTATEESETMPGESSASSGTNPDTGDLDPMCEPNAGDGRSQCAGETCEPGNYCDAIICTGGCESTLNCGTGQWCDLRMPDAFGAGICRPTTDPACGGTPVGDESSSEGGEIEECLIVEGNYVLALDPGSPQTCTELFEGDIQCSVAQDGCTLTWGCGDQSAVLFPPGNLDANGISMTEGTSPDGLAYACTFDFSGNTDDALVWSCSLVGGGGSLVCQGTGN